RMAVRFRRESQDAALRASSVCSRQPRGIAIDPCPLARYVRNGTAACSSYPTQCSFRAQALADEKTRRDQCTASDSLAAMNHDILSSQEIGIKFLDSRSEE